MTTSSTIPSFSSILEAYAKVKTNEEQQLSNRAKPFLTDIIESEMRGVPNKVSIIDSHVADKVYDILKKKGWNVKLTKHNSGDGRNFYYGIKVLVDDQA